MTYPTWVAQGRTLVTSAEGVYVDDTWMPDFLIHCGRGKGSRSNWYVRVRVTGGALGPYRNPALARAAVALYLKENP